MKILFWVPYPTFGASNRYRVEQYLPYLETVGIGYSVHPFWTKRAYGILYEKGHYLRKVVAFLYGTILRLLDILLINRYDAIFIHREAYPIGGAVFETILSILRKRIIFDFDDAIFLHTSSDANNFVDKLKRPDKIKTILRKSKHVITGNRYLSEFALNYNNSVAIVPTSVDTNKFYPHRINKNNEIVIGWMGSSTTVNFLDDTKDVFILLLKQFVNLRLKIIGGKFSLGAYKGVINKRWCLDEEIADLKSFDIGIMPILDNDWSKGKCGFKAILCMSMGIPCVCSDIGANRDIIIDGVNGFLAKTKEEWVNKLSFLITNPKIRYNMGLAGRMTVEEKYSVKVNAPIILQIIKSVCNII